METVEGDQLAESHVPTAVSVPGPEVWFDFAVVELLRLKDCKFAITDRQIVISNRNKI